MGFLSKYFWRSGVETGKAPATVVETAPEVREGIGTPSVPEAPGAAGSGAAGGVVETVPAVRTGFSFSDIFDLSLSTGMAVSTVYRCVQLLSDSVATLPVVIKRKRGGIFVEDTECALAWLLNVEPSPDWNAVDFKRQLVIELLLEGNAYIVPQYSTTRGDYVRLALCGRNTVSHDTVTDTYTVSDYENGIYGTFGESEIIHIKGMPGSNPKKGVSVLRHAAMTLRIASTGDKETLNRFRNGGDVRGIVADETAIRGFGGYQDAELAAKAAELDYQFREMGERIVSMGGALRWIPISMTSADMQFLENRKFTVREICRFFGVHPSFVFDDTSNNYKSAEMANVAFLSNTLNPLLTRIEAEMLRKLFSPSLAVKRKIEFKREAVYACDLQTKAQYESTLLGTGRTVNEVREMSDLPPVADGDIPLVSANLKGISQLIDPVKGEENKND